MSFVKKIWKDRISQFPNRRTINDGHTVKRVTVGRDEGVVTEEGTPFDATEMNDLENRIFAAIEQGGGGGGSSGTYDYSELFNKPRVNNVELNGNKTTADLHINYNDLENKPTIPAAQVQSDWLQADNTQADYVKNKPTIPTRTSDLENDSWFVSLWEQAGDFSLTNGQTGNLTLSQDLTNVREMLICFYINVGTIGKRTRRSILVPRYDIYYTGAFMDELITTDSRVYFQLDYVDSTHLAISSCVVPTGASGAGIRIFVR